MSAHVIHRGNNRCQIFRDDVDRRFFLGLLPSAAARHDVAVHAFVLMTTHFHLIVTPGNALALSRTMKTVALRYVRYFNRKYERVGTLWCGRYRSILIMDPCYWLTCLRYVEQNPVRAGMVSSPDAYAWSSYRDHAFGETTAWLVRHPTYLALGNTENERQTSYRTLCGESLTDGELACQRHPLPKEQRSMTSSPIATAV